MCLRDARFKIFKDSILGMITASMYDGPVYFNCYPDLTLALDDSNIIKHEINELRHEFKSMKSDNHNLKQELT